MKNKVLFALLLMLSLILLTACGPAAGQLPMEGCLEELDYEQQTRPGGDPDGLYEVTEYYSLSEMLLALDSDRADFLLIPFASTAEYISARDEGLSVAIAGQQCSVRMAVLPENSMLRDKLNEALAALEADGTIEALIEEYITNASPDQEPPAIQSQPIDGADTIKVGVTGDLPPLDYISADGAPAGFNTALLSAMAEYLHVNFQLVGVSAPARLSAMVSGNIDVSFWVVDYQGGDGEGDGNLICTQPYYSGSLAYMCKDFPLDQVKDLMDIAD